jgi:hypothetical protein
VTELGDADVHRLIAGGRERERLADGEVREVVTLGVRQRSAELRYSLSWP